MNKQQALDKIKELEQFVKELDKPQYSLRLDKDDDEYNLVIVDCDGKKISYPYIATFKKGKTRIYDSVNRDAMKELGLDIPDKTIYIK